LTYLRAGNHKLEYVRLEGEFADRPTIIFLHEGLGCVAMWRDFPEQVAQATGCEVVVYSRAGYGDSEEIDLPRTIEFMRDEATVVLPELIERLGVNRHILLGHSDGGSIALLYAALAATPNLCGLIAEAPHVFVEDLSIRSIALAKRNYESGSLRERLERYHGKNVDYAFWGWNRVWLDPAFRSWNIEDCLPRIEVPLLVIQGRDDEYGTLAQVKAIEDGCTGRVETLILDDCGHTPHRDQNEKTLQAIEQFVTRLNI
jgi:pimeloyl-ACP methyl ester carboxylesterase